MPTVFWKYSGNSVCKVYWGKCKQSFVHTVRIGSVLCNACNVRCVPECTDIRGKSKLSVVGVRNRKHSLLRNAHVNIMCRTAHASLEINSNMFDTAEDMSSLNILLLLTPSGVLTTISHPDSYGLSQNRIPSLKSLKIHSMNTSSDSIR